MTLRLAVLASGSGSNLKSILVHCDAGTIDARVSLVLSDRPGAGCLQHARDHDVPAIVELPRLEGEKRAAYDARLIDALSAEAPDLIVLAGFMRILTPALCEAFAGRIINIHPALLPSFKGAHGVRDTLAAGAKLAGCTTHYVTADLDGGPIILQAALAVRADDDRDSLAARVLRLEHQILPRTIQLIAEGRVHIDDGIARVAPGDAWDRFDGAIYSDGY